MNAEFFGGTQGKRYVRERMPSRRLGASHAALPCPGCLLPYEAEMPTRFEPDSLVNLRCRGQERHDALFPFGVLVSERACTERGLNRQTQRNLLRVGRAAARAGRRVVAARGWRACMRNTQPRRGWGGTGMTSVGRDSRSADVLQAQAQSAGASFLPHTAICGRVMTGALSPPAVLPPSRRRVVVHHRPDHRDRRRAPHLGPVATYK